MCVIKGVSKEGRIGEWEKLGKEMSSTEVQLQSDPMGVLKKSYASYKQRDYPYVSQYPTYCRSHPREV